MWGCERRAHRARISRPKTLFGPHERLDVPLAADVRAVPDRSQGGLQAAGVGRRAQCFRLTAAIEQAECVGAAPAQQAFPGRPADGGHVVLLQTRPLGRQAIEHGGLDLGVVVADVASTQVVGNNENDVGYTPRIASSPYDSRRCQQQSRACDHG